MSKRVRQNNYAKNGGAAGNSRGGVSGGPGRLRTHLPNRWLYCPPIGKIIAEKFLPIKTPLDNSYDHLIEQQKYFFHPEAVFRTPLSGVCADAQIKLWIDLNNSNNYFRPEEIRKHCEYRKMKMVGHGETPTLEQTEEFIAVIDKFNEEHPGHIVVVHCTHGFNRTGFLIAAYLFKRECLSIEMAVREFAECRPQGIYKEEYLNELKLRYGDEDEELTPPGRPLWENGPVTDEEFTMGGIFTPEGEAAAAEAAVALNGHHKQELLPTNLANTSSAATNNLNITSLLETVAATTPTKSTSSESTTGKQKNIPLFMDGKVRGVHYVEDVELRKSIQKQAATYCDYKGKGFPGSQPVSLEGPQGNNNILHLAKEPYMVSWKADGVRYLVLIDGPGRVFAFDRDNNPFRIDGLTFLRRHSSSKVPTADGVKDADDDGSPAKRSVGNEYIYGTLVDAEMVVDEVNGEQIPRLLIYDLIYLHNTFKLRKENFDVRFNAINHELIDPRTEALKSGRIRREEEPMGVRRKNFWDIRETHKLFRPGFLECHEIDGIVFQPVRRPYTAGRFDCLLKWKPPEMSSIDFRLEIKKVLRPGEPPIFVGELYVLHLDVPFAQIHPTNKMKQLYDHKIVECNYSYKNQCWEIMRQRTDKSHPNAYATAASVLNTIKFPIHREDILRFIHDNVVNRQQQPQHQ